MSSDNSTYEQRIASEEDDRYIIRKDRDRVSVWKECLIEQAKLSSDLIPAITAQAIATNYPKPIGLFFDNMAWVEIQEPGFTTRLENNEVTKQGSLIESFYTFARGYPLEASVTDKPCTYSWVQRDELITALVYILPASNLSQPVAIEHGEYQNLREYVVSHVDWHEERLEEDLSEKVEKRYGIPDASLPT